MLFSCCQVCLSINSVHVRNSALVSTHSVDTSAVWVCECVSVFASDIIRAQRTWAFVCSDKDVYQMTGDAVQLIYMFPYLGPMKHSISLVVGVLHLTLILRSIRATIWLALCQQALGYYQPFC